MEVSRNTLTAERVSIGGSDSTFLPTLGEFVDFVRDYRFEGQFDQVARHRAGQLIAEGHATVAQLALHAVDAGRG